MGPRLLLTLLAACWALPGQAGGDAASGRGAFGLCEACHGVRGEGASEFGAPRLAGIEPWYLRRQLVAFRDGRRGAHPDDLRGRQMRLLAPAVAGDQGSDDMAAYLATLAPPLAAPALPGDSSRGRQLYQACAACHGPAGQGSEPLAAPALARLEDWYLVAQLEAFRAGWRGTADGDLAGAQMRPLALALPDAAALRDVVAYIGTLR